MIKFKTALLAAMVASSAFAAPAFAAAHWEVWDPSTSTWSQNGTLTFTGPTTATVATVPVPCSTAVFSVSLTSGTAVVTGATFSGSSACAGIVAQNLNWGVSPPDIVGPPTPPTNGANLTIGGSFANTIQVKFSQPSATCSNGGTVQTGTPKTVVTNVNPNNGGATPSGPPYAAAFLNNLTFSATFGTGPCTSVKSTSNLVSSKPFRYRP